MVEWLDGWMDSKSHSAIQPFSHFKPFNYFCQNLFSMKYATLFALLLLFACKNKSQTPTTPAPDSPAQGLPEGFQDFYQKFHSDSIFQLSHIVFPLQGLPDNADSLTIAQEDFRWQPNNWVIQRPFDFEMSEFKRQLIPVNEQMVLERIVHQSGQYGMVRRFARVAGEWHLIYYAGMNKLVH